MAHRSARLFRAQFRLLVDLNLLEAAQTRLMAEVNAGHRLRARRARREVVELRKTIDQLRFEVAEWKPPTLPESEVLARLRPLLAVPLPAQPPAPGTTLSQHAVAWLSVLGAGIAWVVAGVDLAARGIGDRPSLVVAEVCAIVLTPIAIALTGRR
jgi:hypothetical protein